MDNLTDQTTKQPSEMSWAELKEYIAASSEQMKETDRMFQEAKKEFQETRKFMHATFDRIDKSYEQEKAEREATKKIADEERKETNRKIKELTTRFTSQSGHIIEGLMETSAMKIFKQSGFDIDKCWKEMKGKNKTINCQMEVDLFYHDTTESIAVEVKINCRKDDIDHFIEQMGYFKQIFPEFSNSTVYAAIAAINYDRESDKYAAERGLFVIRVNDDTFTLDPAQKETRLSF